MAAFQGMSNALPRQFFQGKPIHDSYKTLSQIGKGSLKTASKKAAVPGGMGLVLGAGLLAGKAINSYGKKVRSDIDSMSKQTSDYQNNMNRKIKDELVRRKKMTGKSLMQRQADRRNADSKPLTKSPNGIGVGWGS